MASIHSSHSIAAAYSPVEPDASPDHLLSGVVLAPTHSPAQAAALQNALRAAWTAGAPGTSLDLRNTGLARIDSAARLIPRSVHTLMLGDDASLEALPGDLPDHLRSLSVGNARNLRALPDSLPRGLTLEVGGSGLSLNYLRSWAARHPGAGIAFTFGGLSMALEPATLVGNAQNRRPGWAERTGQGDEAPAAGGSGAGQISEYTQFTVDELRRALAGAVEGPPRDGQAAHADTSSSRTGSTEYVLAAGPEGYTALLAGCEDELGHAMAYWLGGEHEHMAEARSIAGRCVSHLYALEPEDGQGNKLRSAQQIVDDHVERLGKLGEILDRVKHTASYYAGSYDEQLRQQRKVVDLLHLLASDKDQCGTGIAAMIIAGETCDDALATEGLDLVDAMCTAARSKSEAWTPQDFYGKMEQQIKRDKIRAQVGDIVNRMKQEYGDAVIKAIQSDHKASQATFGMRSGSKLSKLVGDRDHVVRRDGSIAVNDPRPGEPPVYAVDERGAYVARQANRKVDDVEVLSLCQKEMASRGLLSDVQAGLHILMHQDSKFSKVLNVSPAELKDMARNLSLNRAEVLARMTAWDPWTDYLDREGHTDAVRNDPQLQHDHTQLAARMEALRETLADFTGEHALEHPEAGQDFALLNNLINAVGTRAVSRHELLRMGGQDADAITFDDKERYLAEGVARLAQLQSLPAAAARGEARPSARRTLATRVGLRVRTGESARDAGRHRASPGETGAGSVSAAAPTFEAGRLALFKSVINELKGQGPSPYQAALLRKTEELVGPARR